MNDTQPPPLPKRESSNPVVKKSHSGGWIAGCLAAVVLMVISLLCLGGYLTYTSVRDVAESFDDNSSVTPFVPSDDQKKKLRDKLDALQKAQKEGGECALTLDSDDINTFISSSSSFGYSKTDPRFAINLEGDVIRGKLSVPVEKDGATKYLNCDAVLSVSINHGKLDVRLKDVLLKGKRPPLGLRLILGQFQNQNLGRRINTDFQHRDLRRKLRHCEKFEVRDGKIYLKLKFPEPSKEAQ